jgi:hypothetical protein
LPSRGIIYSATGRSYVDEAIASATSSLRFNDYPHLIFCDEPPEAAPATANIEFRIVASSGDPRIDKIRSFRRTPFEHTLYLDTDTYVAGDIGELFDLLQRFDMAAAHAPGYTKCEDEGQSEAFYDYNSGVIAYRRAQEVDDFFAAWEKIYSAWLTDPPFPQVPMDQPSFRRAFWESRLSGYVIGPEYNYRSIFPGRLVGRAKIIHGRNKNYEKLAAYINALPGVRTFPPFSPDADW